MVELLLEKAHNSLAWQCRSWRSSLQHSRALTGAVVDTHHAHVCFHNIQSRSLYLGLQNVIQEDLDTTIKAYYLSSGCYCLSRCVSKPLCMVRTSISILVLFPIESLLRTKASSKVVFLLSCYSLSVLNWPLELSLKK